MNFQLHLPHGLLLFVALACLVSVIGNYGMKFLTRNTPSDSDSRQGLLVGAIFCFLAAAVALIVGIVMAFLCPYSAYAFLTAIFFVAAGVSAGRQSDRVR